MIFAAGLGTRLYPFTQMLPKALVEVNGVTLLERVIVKLKSAGVSEIIINLHHFPEKIIHFLQSKNNFNISIVFSHEDHLLDTGGGLLKAAHFFDDGNPFLVHNTDIISNIDLLQMLQFHELHAPLATLFVQKRNSSRYLLFDQHGHLKGWQNNVTGQEIMVSGTSKDFRPLAFNGIHIIEPKIFELINNSGTFSIIPQYIELAKNHRILAFQNDQFICLDVGKPEAIEQAEKMEF